MTAVHAAIGIAMVAGNLAAALVVFVLALRAAGVAGFIA